MASTPSTQTDAGRDEPAVWHPRRGPLTRLTAVLVLAAMAVCLLLMVIAMLREHSEAQVIDTKPAGESSSLRGF